MQEFIDKVNLYIKDRYNFQLEVGEYTINGKDGIIIDQGTQLYIQDDEDIAGIDIEDSQDFEEVVIKYVNDYINGTSIHLNSLEPLHVLSSEETKEFLDMVDLTDYRNSQELPEGWQERLNELREWWNELTKED